MIKILAHFATVEVTANDIIISEIFYLFIISLLASPYNCFRETFQNL